MRIRFVTGVTGQYHIFVMDCRTALALRNDEFNEVLGWCVNQFGKPEESFAATSGTLRRWTFSGQAWVVIFRDEIDATAFKIRWG